MADRAALASALRAARRWSCAIVGELTKDPRSPLLSIVLAPIAKLRRAHLVNGLQEVFPEVAEALKAASERQWDKEKALAEWEALLQAVGHPHLG
jgi:hypothetical protein